MQNNLKNRVCRIIWWLMSVWICSCLLIGSAFYVYTGNPFGFVKFFRTLHIVETQYAGAVDKSALLDGALEGIVAKLDDKHSIYLDGDKYEFFSSQTSGTYGGIGVYLSNYDGQAMINEVMPGEPADEAGIRRGDTIIAINNDAVQEMNLADVSNEIRGKAGTTVSLTLRRDGQDFTVDVARRRIRMKTVAGQMLPGTDIGYIRVAIFSENTGKEFTEQYEALRQQGMNKVILDLRNNPGGLLDQALQVANNFFPEGSTLCSYVDRQGQETDYTVSGGGTTLPMIILVNENTASAAEIVAGSVQDLKLGTLVGTNTYGKGTVQGIYAIDEQNAVKVTVAKYKTANGRTVDGTGVAPDDVVPLQPNDEVDHQFARAYELLNQ